MFPDEIAVAAAKGWRIRHPVKSGNDSGQSFMDLKDFKDGMPPDGGLIGRYLCFLAQKSSPCIFS